MDWQTLHNAYKSPSSYLNTNPAPEFVERCLANIVHRTWLHGTWLNRMRAICDYIICSCEFGIYRLSEFTHFLYRHRLVLVITNP
jgi:hypothetical protein